MRATLNKLQTELDANNFSSCSPKAAGYWIVARKEEPHKAVRKPQCLIYFAHLLFSLPCDAVSHLLNNLIIRYIRRPFQWPRRLRRRSAAARLLRLWVRTPPGAWTFFCCECCQIEVSATSWSLVQTSPTDCGVSSECDLDTSWMRRPWPTGGLLSQKQTTLISQVGRKCVLIFPLITHHGYLLFWLSYQSFLVTFYSKFVL
jgi:hypothetical protein